MEKLLQDPAPSQSAWISDFCAICTEVLPELKSCTTLYPQRANENQLQIEERRLVDKVLEKPNDQKSKTPVSN